MLIPISNNKADQAYLKLGTGIESCHIPSLCLYTNVTHEYLSTNLVFSFLNVVFTCTYDEHVCHKHIPIRYMICIEREIMLFIGKPKRRSEVISNVHDMHKHQSPALTLLHVSTCACIYIYWYMYVLNWCWFVVWVFVYSVYVCLRWWLQLCLCACLCVYLYLCLQLWLCMHTHTQADIHTNNCTRIHTNPRPRTNKHRLVHTLNHKINQKAAPCLGSKHLSETTGENVCVRVCVRAKCVCVCVCVCAISREGELACTSKKVHD